MLCILCIAVCIKSHSHTPRGKTALDLGYGKWCGSVWKDGEREWNFMHDGAFFYILPVRQPKCYVLFVFPEVSSTEVRGSEGTENLSKWGPKSIIIEKACVHTLSRMINCGEHRHCHSALTTFQPCAKEPSCVCSKMPREGIKSTADLQLCTHPALYTLKSMRAALPYAAFEEPFED